MPVTPFEPSSISDDVISTIESLADKSLFLQAYELTQPYGDFRHWQSDKALAVAIRLSRHLGAQRLSRALCFRAYRRNPHSEPLRLSYLTQIVFARGPHRAWEFFRDNGHLIPQQSAARAEWLSSQAYCHALLYDFKCSHELHAEAIAYNDADPWLNVEYSHILEQEDRHVEALDLVLQVLETHPDYMSAIWQAAHMESMLGQEAAATQRLRSAAGRLESRYLCDALVDLLISQQQWEEAQHWLQKSEHNQPLREAQVISQLAARRCDIFCQTKAFPQAIEAAETAGKHLSFYARLAERLTEHTGERRQLPVPFIAQHRMTCSPATLSALSLYWQRPFEHLQITDDICYNGTSYQNERDWCEKHQWRVREFRVDWPTTQLLIDQGIPFAMSVNYGSMGHMLAVVGYDSTMGTLLIRDPSQTQLAEYDAEQFLTQQAFFGPRGLLILPESEQARLESLPLLPEQTLYEHYYRHNTALKQNQPAVAQEALHALQQIDPKHRLTGLSEYYTYLQRDDIEQALAVIESLLEGYPDTLMLMMCKADALASLANWQTQVDWLEACLQRRPYESGLLVRLATLLMSDRQNQPRVHQLLRLALRCSATQPEGWIESAGMLWMQHQHAESLELYRIATTLQPLEERYPAAYARALTYQGQRQSAREYLLSRYQQLGPRSPDPALTLCEHLDEWSEDEAWRETLLQAHQQHPKEATLLLQLGEYYGRKGDFANSLRYNEAAKPLARESRWLFSHLVYHLRLLTAGQPEVDINQLLSWSRQLVSTEALNVAVHRMHLQLVEYQQGAQSALAALTSLLERFPLYAAFTELEVEYIQRLAPGQKVAVLERWLKHHPLNLWAKRELITCKVLQGRYAEARNQCRELLLQDPYNSYSHSTLGYVELHCGETKKARAAFRQALIYSADNSYASHNLLRLSTSLTEEHETLAFIHAELSRQNSISDGWQSYQQQAFAVLSNDTLLAQLRQAEQALPDNWQLQLALIRQLALMQRYDDALEAVRLAKIRFPDVLPLVREEAFLYRYQGQNDRYQQIITQNFASNPTWVVRAYDYAMIQMEKEENWPQIEQFLRLTLLRAPEDNEIRAALASILLRQQKLAEAEQTLRQLLLTEPAHLWGWDLLTDCHSRQQQPEQTRQFAEWLVEQRPEEADALYALGRLQEDPAEQERLWRESLKYNAIRVETHEALLGLLLNSARYDELSAQVHAKCWGETIPVTLAIYEPRADYLQGQHAQAISKLQELLARYPYYFDGWRQLADWMEAAEDYTEYVTAARHMVSLQPHNAISQGFLGHALRLSGEEFEALPSFERAFSLDSQYLFAGLNAFVLLEQKTDYRQCEIYLRQMIATSPTEEVLLRGLAYAIRRRDPDLQILALEPLCTLPSLINCWDQTEEQLRGQEDTVALQVLERLGMAGRLHPRALSHWLGLPHNQEKSDHLLKEVLQQHPDYYFGWQVLADRMEQQEAWQEYVRCAEQMVRLQPDNAAAFGYLGHAQRLAKQPDLALNHLQQALTLSPDYFFAGMQLFEVMSELDYPVESVCEHLRMMLERFKHGQLLLGALPYAIRHAQYDLQRQILHIACCDDNAGEYWGSLLSILDGRESLLDEQLSVAMQAGSLGRTACFHWLQQADSRGKKALWPAFEQLLPTDHQHIAKYVMLEILAERPAKDTVNLLHKTLAECRTALTENGQVWGMASYALVSHDLYDIMLARLSDWAERRDLPEWGLNNLALALRMTWRDAEAQQVSERILQIAPGHLDAHIWLALDAALSGNHQKAEEHLQGIPQEEVRPFMQPYYLLVRGYLQAHSEHRSTAALAWFRRGKELAHVSNYAYWRLRGILGKRLAFSPLTPWILRFWRYLQLH